MCSTPWDWTGRMTAVTRAQHLAPLPVYGAGGMALGRRPTPSKANRPGSRSSGRAKPGTSAHQATNPRDALYCSSTVPLLFLYCWACSPAPSPANYRPGDIRNCPEGAFAQNGVYEEMVAGYLDNLG